MNRNRLKVLIVTAAALVAAGFAVAQLIEPPPSPAPLFPEGALVYAEARDLKQLLSWWKDSGVRTAWLDTSNHSEFENSRLYQRLDERLSEFGKGQFAFNLENLIEIAGTRSALALYDIGELKAVAVTRVGFAEASASELWASRAKLRQKKFGNQNYYIEPTEGKLAFAFAKPYLVIASEESLLQDVLKAMKDPQPSGRLTQSEKWKQFDTRKPANDALLSLFLDQENLNTNRYFRNYWLPQNVDDLKSIQAAWIDLNLQEGAIVEHRYFVRSGEETAPPITDVQDYLKPFQAVHRESLKLSASPKSPEIVDNMLNYLNRLPAGEPVAGAPPVYSAAVDRLSKAEARSAYLEKIDEPILTPASDKLLHLDQGTKLQALLDAAGPVAQLQLGYPLWDDRALFVQFPRSLAVQCDRFESLDQQAFLDLLLEYFRTLHSTQDQGARWMQRAPGTYVLDSLLPVYVRFQKPWLLISSREQEFQQAAAALPPAAVAPQSSYQEFELEKARWKYARLMKRLDTGAYSGDSPMFFSDSLNSLIQITEPIQRASILRNNSEEIIRYELK